MALAVWLSTAVPTASPEGAADPAATVTPMLVAMAPTG